MGRLLAAVSLGVVTAYLAGSLFLLSVQLVAHWLTKLRPRPGENPSRLRTVLDWGTPRLIMAGTLIAVVASAGVLAVGSSKNSDVAIDTASPLRISARFRGPANVLRNSEPIY